MTDDYAKRAERSFLSRYGLPELDVSTSCDWKHFFKTKKYQIDDEPMPRMACGSVRWAPSVDTGLIVPSEEIDAHKCTVYVFVTGDPSADEPWTFRGWAWGFEVAKQGGDIPAQNLLKSLDSMMAAVFGLDTLAK